MPQLPISVCTLQATQTGAAQINTATLAPPAGQVAYLSGFCCSGGGATAALGIDITVAGINTTLHFTSVIPAGAGVPWGPFEIIFPTPLAGSAPGVAIVVTLPSFGAGNTAACVSAWGFSSQS